MRVRFYSPLLDHNSFKELMIFLPQNVNSVYKVGSYNKFIYVLYHDSFNQQSRLLINSERICIFNTILKRNVYKCTEIQLFNEQRDKSSKFKYIKTVNLKTVFSMLFYEETESKYLRIIRLTPTFLVKNNLNFNKEEFFINSKANSARNFDLQGYSFKTEDSDQIISVLIINDSKRVFIIKLTESGLSEPFLFGGVSSDVFVNKKHIMLLDYKKRELTFFNLFSNLSFTRKIWPSIKIKSVSNDHQVRRVNDFILVRLADKNTYASILLKDQNPVINKTNTIKTNFQLNPKYLMTNKVSLVIVDTQHKNQFIAFLRSYVVSFDLKILSKKTIYEVTKNKNKLFSFFVVLESMNQMSYTHLIQILLPNDYIINRKESRQADFKNRFNLSSLFKGNIYKFDFFFKSSDTDQLERLGKEFSN